MSHGIYTASRTKHAHLWRDARSKGLPIISTWIDEAGEGESPSMLYLWIRCIEEATNCKALILYRESDEPLKGALLEAGAALSALNTVYAVGFNGPDDMKVFSFLYHPKVIRCESLEVAFHYANLVAGG